MQTRVATASAGGSAAAAAVALAKEVERQLAGTAPALAMVFASTVQPLAQLLPALQELLPDTTLFGASTAGEFTERGDSKGAAAIFAVAGDFVAHAVLERGLRSGTESAVARAVGRLPLAVAGLPYRTAVLLLDPLSGRAEEVTLAAAALLGDDVRLAGGAAGDDLKMKETWVGCDGTAASDALMLAVISSAAPLGVGVCHGHEPISPWLRVTRAEGNVVQEIEGRPAWDVWAEHTRAAAARIGVDLDALAGDAIGQFLLRFEAGLTTGGGLKIRAPLSRGADGSLTFVSGIPRGTLLRITESDAERQIESAREAARRAQAQTGAPAAGAVVFDCICRNLILGRDFQRAVRAISSQLGDVPLAGFETYGEIALAAGDMSGFHNTTTVVLTFPR